jgi:glyoxylase-like metal-dependent hydrolase (beta-lactamase superfamily II)
MATPPDFFTVLIPPRLPFGPANVYVFPDDPVTLFDCGPNARATENALVLGLAEHGLHLEQIARVVISHGHPDHYGLAPLSEKSPSGAACWSTSSHWTSWPPCR